MDICIISDTDHRDVLYFLRATAVPAGTAERVLSMAILSVRLSRPGTDSRPGEIETPGFHRMVA